MKDNISLNLEIYSTVCCRNEIKNVHCEVILCGKINFEIKQIKYKIPNFIENLKLLNQRRSS